MTVRIRALAAVMVGMRALRPDEVAAVDALQAALVVGTGRAELVDERDAPKLREAIAADTAAALKREGRPWRHPEPSPPWQRRR